jgi:hypothetical protein
MLNAVVRQPASGISSSLIFLCFRRETSEFAIKTAKFQVQKRYVTGTDHRL